MKELIEEAEELYKQIDKAQVHLINARLQSDEEGKKSAISEMETAMCNAMQLLKCFIERKDNIVDLGEVWHDVSHKPKRNKFFVFNEFSGWNIVKWLEGYKAWRLFVKISNMNKWAYLDDLFPKGDSK